MCKRWKRFQPGEGLSRSLPRDCSTSRNLRQPSFQALLQEADYSFQHNNPGWRIILDIRIDRGGGEAGAAVRRIARNFNFTHGSKHVHVESEHR